MRRSLVLCVLFVFLMAGAGCGRSSFVGKRLDNFSAYYNTFYNAEKALDEGVKAIDTGQAEQEVDQDLYLPLFGGSDRGTTQRKPFEDAILKCADILRKHPDSKWVDDAVLVIGQSSMKHAIRLQHGPGVSSLRKRSSARSNYRPKLDLMKAALRSASSLSTVWDRRSQPVSATPFSQSAPCRRCPVSRKTHRFAN